jgi:hypothetical protein
MVQLPYIYIYIYIQLVKGGPMRGMTKHVREAYLGFYGGKFPHVRKRFVMKQSNCSPSGKDKKVN